MWLMNHLWSEHRERWLDLENEREDLCEMKRIIVWRDSKVTGRKQAREWQTCEATREDVRTVSEWRRVKECSVGKGKKRARRRAREACHSSVDEECSLWEPLSSNSPVGQPHTHFTCRKLTQTPIHARGTCSQFRRLSLTHTKTFLHAIGRRNGWYDGRTVFMKRFILPCFTLFTRESSEDAWKHTKHKTRMCTRNNLLLIGAKMLGFVY